jgi:hypothetical protein
MKRIIFAVALAAAVPAVAAEKCTSQPLDQWLRPEEVQVRLEAKGYEVRRVKREGACFEVQARKQGKRVEALVNPVDAAIVTEKQKKKS